MRKVFEFFTTKHLFANLITIMVILIGVWTLTKINRNQLPNVDLGFMAVNTIYPGASAEDVELNVTNKLENSLKGVTGIKEIFSSSIENTSILFIMIDPDVKDPKKVKDKIREAVSRTTDLPPEVTDVPLVTEGTSAVFPIIDIGIIGNVPYREIRKYAKTFKKKLKDIDGVNEITSYGYRGREIKIEVSPSKIQDYQIPLREIMQQIQGRNIRSSGGNLESYTSEKNVVTLAQFSNPIEVGDVIVRAGFDGQIVHLKDLSIIKDDFEDEVVIPRMNGREGISFQVAKSENADIIRTVARIKKQIESEKKNLPEGIELIITFDMSKYVKNMFQVVAANGLLGLLFVLIILALFLNLKSAFWVAMGIPFSLFTAIMLLPFFNVDLDTVTLMSLVLVIGIIVDDAIIISELIFQKREEGLPPLEAVVSGVNEVYKPVVVTILTTFLVFAPMFYMKGMLGKFVYVIPLTISLAIFASLFEALFILPAHILPGMKKSITQGKSSSRNWFKGVRINYEKMMRKVISHRYLWMIVSVFVIIGVLTFAYFKMSFVLFPTKGADFFYALIELPTGSSLRYTNDKVKELEKILNELPEGEVESYLIRVGAYASDFLDTNSENLATLYVNLTPYSRRKRTAERIVEEVREKSDQLKGFNKIIYEIDSGGPSTGKPIEIRIIGSDDRLRKQLAIEIIDFLNKMEGVKDINRSDILGKDQVMINIDYVKLAQYGLTVHDVADNVRISYDGQVVTRVRYGDEDVDFRLMVESNARKKISYLKKLLIPNNQNRMIPLGNFASFEIGPGVTSISHYNGERSITITGDIFEKRTTPKLVGEAVSSSFNMEKYPGLRLKIGGEAEESAKAMVDLLLTFAIAILAIYFLLVMLFNSFAQPVLVMVAIPFGIVGIIIAFALHLEPIGFLGMIGLIGMSGVVVNDSLVMVNHLNTITRNLEDKNQMLNVIARGAADRLRAIILTTLTTVSGMIPLVYGIGGENVFMRPMALALGYGLLFATPTTLIIVPSLYMISYDIKMFFYKRRKTI